MDKDFVEATTSSKVCSKFICWEWTSSNNNSSFNAISPNAGVDLDEARDFAQAMDSLITKKLEVMFTDGYPKLNTSNCVYRIVIDFDDFTGELIDMYCGVYNGSLVAPSNFYSGVPSMNWTNKKDMKTYKRVY